MRWALSKESHQDAAVKLHQSHAEAAMAVWEYPPQPVNASELDELARAPTVRTLQLSPANPLGHP